MTDTIISAFAVLSLLLLTTTILTYVCAGLAKYKLLSILDKCAVAVVATIIDLQITEDKNNKHIFYPVFQCQGISNNKGIYYSNYAVNPEHIRVGDTYLLWYNPCNTSEFCVPDLCSNKSYLSLRSLAVRLNIITLIVQITLAVIIHFN